MKADKRSFNASLMLDEEEAADLRLIEEIFYRINQSQSVELYAPLAKKSLNKKTLAELMRIERAIINKARQRNNF